MPESQTILESDLPLAQSLIWRLQRDFYGQRGLKVWTEDRVPEYITNNPFIAEMYAHIVSNFLADCAQQVRILSKNRPLRILELGAGHGKFCYLFLKQLARVLPEAPVRYCMTDCSEALLESWRTNPYLAEFVDSGMLEFELFQAGEKVPEAVESKLSGNPLVVIASYIFDSLPQDAFVIQDGKLLEALVTVRTKPGEAQAQPPLSDLQLSYKNVEIASPGYTDEIWNQILNEYRTRVPAATVLFPCEALRVLQELGALGDGRMLVLAADKGTTHEENPSFSQGPPTIEFHAPNCFSQMVNFNAIGKYFEAIGGEFFLPDKHFAGLSICGFLRRNSGDQFSTTKKAYLEAQEAFGPDDLFTLFGWLNAHMEEMSIPQILAALRLTRWDPVAFMRLFPVFARQLRNVTVERHDLRNAALRTWDNHYPIKAADNALAFQCGVVLLELRFFEEAMAMFRKSEQIVAPSAATSYNLGLCAIGLGRASEALALMVQACEQDPSFEPARLSRTRLEADLKDQRDQR